MGFVHKRPRVAGDAKAAESLLLLFFTYILMSIGVLYLPRPSTSIHFDSYLVAQVPVSACDTANCFNPVKNVLWAESHSREMNGPFVTAWADRLPLDPGANTVRVGLVVQYEHPVVEDTDFSMSFDLPPGAHMVRCASTLNDDSTSGCGERITPPSDVPITRAQHVIGASGTMKKSAHAVLIADIQGTRGLAFDESGGEMVVRHPIMIPAPPSFSPPSSPPGVPGSPMSPPAGHACRPSGSAGNACVPASGTQSDPVSPPRAPGVPTSGPITVVQAPPQPDPIEVYTGVVADGTGTMRWTEMPSAGIAGSPGSVATTAAGKADNATWKYSIDRDGMGVPPPPDIRGVSDAAIAADTKNTFYAGLAFGTGGAAFTISVQLFYGWLRKPAKQQVLAGYSKTTVKRNRRPPTS